MNFDDFDAAMRTYEQSLDQKILPKMYIVARLDGRGFTKMTNEHFEKPFDERFKNMMVEVTRGANEEQRLSCDLRIYPE